MTEDAAVPDVGRMRRLERRVARERLARIEAEDIAERGLRELWEVNQTLDAKVAARTAELSETTLRLELALATRERVLANLGHELRTPLTAVVGGLELARASSDSAERDQMLATASDAAERVTALLNELFDLVEIDGGSLALTASAFSPHVPLVESVRRGQRRAAEAGVLLALDLEDAPEGAVVGDPERVAHVISRLIDRALDAGAAPVIRLGAVADDGAVRYVMSAPVPAGVASEGEAAATQLLEAPVVVTRLLELMGSELEVEVSGGDSILSFVIAPPESPEV